MTQRNIPEERRHRMQVMVRLRKELAQPVEAFGALNRTATEDGALSKKHKELIALGISITAHCDGCIAAHVDDALRAGATREEIVETIGVALLMGGGPASMYGIEAYEALEQFLARSSQKTA